MNSLQRKRADYSVKVVSGPARILEIPADCAGLRLDQALARLLPEHSRSRLAAWVKQGKVSLGDTPADPKRKVWGGERITLDVAPLPEETAQQPEDIPLEILHEDEDILVVNKPAGLVVHPGSGNWQGTLLNALLHHAPQLAGIARAGIVHRLDKDTSGLLVVAKTLEAQTDLVRQLQARTVKRHYLALAHGVVARDGVVDAPIGRHPVQRTKMAVVGGGRAARTHYHVLERFARASLLECALETGRTHQIRVHMANIGHPLVGDPVYGPRRAAQPSSHSPGRPKNDLAPSGGGSGAFAEPGAQLIAGFPRQALHAWRLALVHPATRVEMGWEAPLPEDFSKLLDALRTEAA